EGFLVLARTPRSSRRALVDLTGRSGGPVLLGRVATAAAAALLLAWAAAGLARRRRRRLAGRARRSATAEGSPRGPRARARPTGSERSPRRRRVGSEPIAQGGPCCTRLNHLWHGLRSLRRSERRERRS